MYVPLWPGFAYKPHQITAIEWMLAREDHEHSGGLVCDEMGLGKTMEILGTIKNSKKRETLLLCPKAVLTQWRDASAKSGLNVMELTKTGWVPTGPFRAGGQFVFMTNYDKLTSQNRSWFMKRGTWHRVVLDEAHRARNAKGALYGQIKDLPRKTMWCVTATPIVNEIKDVRALFMLLGHNGTKLTNYEYLCERVADSCIHRSMDEMRLTLPELPAPPSIKKVQLDFDTEEEAEFYQGIQGKIEKRWKALERDNVTAMFVLITRLRQLSLHPQVYINARRREWIGYEREDWVGSSTKFTALRRALEEPGQAPKRWIVFTQFHEEMNILETYLNESPAVAVVQQYHGGLSDSEKDDVLERTKEPLGEEHQVLLLQLQSGGVGLNLQHFSKIVFMSPWWTAALMDQAIGRAVRIGQGEVVEVLHLVLKEEETMNIDELMLAKVEEKRTMLTNLFAHASRGIGVPLPGQKTEAEARPEDDATPEDPTN